MNLGVNAREKGFGGQGLSPKRGKKYEEFTHLLSNEAPDTSAF